MGKVQNHIFSEDVVYGFNEGVIEPDSFFLSSFTNTFSTEVPGVNLSSVIKPR